MAALYDPAFAYAENALRNLQDAKPDSDIYEEGNASSVGVHIDGGQDETLDARLLLVQLRDALNNLNTGRSESKEIDRAHAEALGKLFQQLFDDPTLEVDVQSQIYTDRLARLEIQGGCPTPCGEPACYVIGKNKLKVSCEADADGTVGVQQRGMLAYKNAFLEKTVSTLEQLSVPCISPQFSDTHRIVTTARLHLPDHLLSLPGRRDRGHHRPAVRRVFCRLDLPHPPLRLRTGPRHQQR